MTICIPLPADTGSIPFTQIHALRFAAGRLPHPEHAHGTV